MVHDALINRILGLINTDITEVAIGTGIAPTLSSDTVLNGEALRKLSTNFVSGSTLIVEGFWDTSEANGSTYTDTAIFGNGATSTLGTGEMDVSGTISIVKDSTQSMTVSHEITVTAI